MIFKNDDNSKSLLFQVSIKIKNTIIRSFNCIEVKKIIEF